MSQESVEVVLEGIRHFEASDFDALARLWGPGVRVTGPKGWPEPGPFEGREAAIGQFRRLAAHWKQQAISDVEVLADRADWVIVRFRWEARGDRSGAATAAAFVAAYRIEGGRICEANFRWTPEEAFEAAGLPE
jgi:ketosteroid isomerase-like protein